MPNTRIGAGPVPARTCGTRADWHRLPGATLNGSFGCRPSNRPVWPPNAPPKPLRSEEHTSELQSPCNLVCRLLLQKKQNNMTLHRRLAEAFKDLCAKHGKPEIAPAETATFAEYFSKIRRPRAKSLFSYTRVSP